MLTAQLANKVDNTVDVEIKNDLKSAYHILSKLGLDDHTYTHVSSRSENADYYYIYPFGQRFSEVSEDKLLKVSLDGEIVEGEEYQYNKTGYIIHGNIYKARPDISSIFHIHTISTVAVSCMEEGLMPISQWALHFYDRVSYHEYNSLALNEEHGRQIENDLGQNYVLFLRNHGVVTAGRTIYEAMFYTYHLEQACKVQVASLSMNRKLIIPSQEKCKQTNHDLLNFETDLGKRDWQAWLRFLY